jgi:hypothetical protein
MPSVDGHEVGFIVNLPERGSYGGSVVWYGRAGYGMVTVRYVCVEEMQLIVWGPIKLSKSGVIFCFDVKNSETRGGGGQAKPKVLGPLQSKTAGPAR